MRSEEERNGIIRDIMENWIEAEEILSQLDNANEELVAAKRKIKELEGLKSGTDGEYKADLIQCPHCNHKHDDYDDYIEVGDMGGDFEMDCGKCKQSFKVDFYSVYWFKSEK